MEYQEAAAKSREAELKVVNAKAAAERDALEVRKDPLKGRPRGAQRSVERPPARCGLLSLLPLACVPRAMRCGHPVGGRFTGQHSPPVAKSMTFALEAMAPRHGSFDHLLFHRNWCSN